MGFVFNPFTGTFDAVGSTDPIAAPLIFAAVCGAGDSVNEFVCIGGDSAGGPPIVTQADPTDITKMPAIGVIVSKSSSTSCLVAWFGVVTLGATLTPNDRYFLGSGGTAVGFPPPVRPVILQVLGQALDSTRLLLTPSKDLLKLHA